MVYLVRPTKIATAPVDALKSMRAAYRSPLNFTRRTKRKTIIAYSRSWNNATGKNISVNEYVSTFSRVKTSIQQIEQHVCMDNIIEHCGNIVYDSLNSVCMHELKTKKDCKWLAFPYLFNFNFESNHKHICFFN